MSNILNNLGIDQDNFEWYHLALCDGLDTNLFFDKYETDVNIAKSVDDMCLSCPVTNMCFQAGIDKKEDGVWGGVYLSTGEIDKTRNIHKTEDLWKRLKKKNVHR